MRFLRAFLSAVGFWNSQDCIACLFSLPMGLQKLSKFFNESSISSTFIMGLQELGNTEYYKSHNNLLISLYILCRVDGRLLCFPEEPPNPGRQFLPGTSMTPGRGFIAAVHPFSTEQYSVVYYRVLELMSECLQD